MLSLALPAVLVARGKRSNDTKAMCAEASAFCATGEEQSRLRTSLSVCVMSQDTQEALGFQLSPRHLAVSGHWVSFGVSCSAPKASGGHRLGSP